MTAELTSGRVIPATVNIFRGYGNQMKLDGSDGKFAGPLRMAANSECLLVTADGKVLARTTGLGQAAAVLRDGMKKWQQLPEPERKPGTVTIRPLMKERSPLAPLPPPPGGLVLAVHTRNLKRDARGELAHITAEDIKDKSAYPGWDIAYTEPTRDNLWLTETEVKSLLPDKFSKGDTFAVPAAIRERIFLFHLWDLTQGGLERPWGRPHLRAGELTFTVEETAPLVRLRLEGSVRFTAATKPERGFQARFEGFLDGEAPNKTVRGFNFVAVGETWGGGSGDSRFVRPGRALLAMAFELATGDRPIDRIAPVGLANLAAGYTGPYFTPDKR